MRTGRSQFNRNLRYKRQAALYLRHKNKCKMNQVSNKITISAKDPPLSVMKDYRYTPIDVTKASKNPFVIEVNAYVSAQKNKEASQIRRALVRSNMDLNNKFDTWTSRLNKYRENKTDENAHWLKKYQKELNVSGQENFQLMQQLYNLSYKIDRNGQLVDALPIHVERYLDLDTDKWKFDRINTMELSKSEIERSNNLRKDIETKLNQFWLN